MTLKKGDKFNITRAINVVSSISITCNFYKKNLNLQVEIDLSSVPHFYLNVLVANVSSEVSYKILQPLPKRGHVLNHYRFH